MLPLPEMILLFALRDQDGRVHSSAFLSLDDALATAVLGELMLRGLIRVRRDRDVRWGVGASTGAPLLDTAVAVLREAQVVGEVRRWIEALKRGMPDLRDRVTDSLVARGALSTQQVDRAVLADTARHPTRDGSWEERAVRDLRLAVACGSDIPRRMGLAVGLVHLCELWGVFDDPGLTANGRGMGEWVLGRDPLCQAARASIHDTHGTHGRLG